MAKRTQKPKPVRNTRPPRKRAGAGPGGRPSKFTPLRQKRILDAVRAGNYLETAAAFGGVHYDTLNEWIKRGDAIAKELSVDEDDIAEALPDLDPLDREFYEFSEAVRREAAEAEVGLVLEIRAAAYKDWRAADAMLSKRYQERWGRRFIQKEISGPGGGPIRTRDETPIVSDADRLARLSKLLGASA